MTESSEHDHLKSLIAPYVLGALPAEEAPAVRSHILGCDECRADADGFSRVSGSLALLVEPVALPDGFSERVLTAVRDDRISTPSTTRAPALGWRRRWGVLVSYAALSLAVLGLGWGYLDARSDLEQKRTLVGALLQGDGGFELRGHPAAVAKVVPSRTGPLFVATGLAQAPDSQTYQLWLIKGKRPVSAGTFDASDQIVVLELERSLKGSAAVAVTIEPDGGSKLPTTTPIMASDRELLG